MFFSSSDLEPHLPVTPGSFFEVMYAMVQYKSPHDLKIYRQP